MAYTKEEAAKLIIRAGQELLKNGFIVRTWGNVSARISDTQFMITPSGVSFDQITENDIVTVNIPDLTHEGEKIPSGEKDIHGGIYKSREDVNFIIITHQLYGTAYGSIGQDLSEYADEYRQIIGSKIICTQHAAASSKKLALKVVETAVRKSECYGFFIKYHGVLSLGKDFEHAFSVATSIEDICMQKVTGKLKFALEGKEGTEIAVTDRIRSKFPNKRVMFVTSPAIVAISEKYLKLRPTIDDLAQIGGVNINCIDYDDDFEFAIKKAVGKNNVALVRKCGAIVVADNIKECAAVGIVLDKNCTALLFELVLGPAHHIGYFDAFMLRRTYINKYSKLNYTFKPAAAPVEKDEPAADKEESAAPSEKDEPAADKEESAVPSEKDEPVTDKEESAVPSDKEEVDDDRENNES